MGERAPLTRSSASLFEHLRTECCINAVQAVRLRELARRDQDIDLKLLSEDTGQVQQVLGMRWQLADSTADDGADTARHVKLN